MGGQTFATFKALGWGGQEIWVVPRSDLVVVFTGVNYTVDPPCDELMIRYVLPALNMVIAHKTAVGSRPDGIDLGYERQVSWTQYGGILERIRAAIMVVSDPDRDLGGPGLPPHPIPATAFVGTLLNLGTDLRACRHTKISPTHNARFANRRFVLSGTPETGG